MKKILILSSIAIIVIVAICLTIFFAPNTEIHVTACYNNESNTVHIKDQYFYIQNNTLYKSNGNDDENKDEYLYEFPANTSVILKAYDDHIWAYAHGVSDDQFTILNIDGSLISNPKIAYSGNTSKCLLDFIAIKDTVYCVGNEEEFVLKINDDTATEQSVDFQRIITTEDIDISSYTNTPVVMYKLENSINDYTVYNIHNKNNNEWIHSYSLENILFDDNDDSISLFSQQKDSITFTNLQLTAGSKKEVSPESTYNTTHTNNLMFYLSDSKLMLLTSNVISEYPPYGNFDDMKGHKNDNLCIYDIQNHELSAVYKTHRHERIIYADDYKAVTYYKGKYLFRSLDDWSITSKLPADEIKRGGSYTFDSCGDYIFVFDTESGELLNKVNIS